MARQVDAFLSGFQPRTTRGEWDKNGIVHEFIDEQKKAWNQNLHYEMFTTKETTTFNSKPLSGVGSPNRLV